MMNNKKILIALILVLILALAGLIVGFLLPGDAAQTPSLGATEPSGTTKPHQQPQGTTQTQPSSGTEQTEPSQPTAISFPYTIPGTSLVIQKIDSYDGIFLEDGSDREVTGISTMVLKNNGDTAVEYVSITLDQEGTQLRFEGTAIPAGAIAVLQETGATAYRDAEYRDCVADVAQTNALEMSAGTVSVTENQNGSLQVTNLTDETIPCVRVFYKFALLKGKIYVGGITYTAEVMDLGPGESVSISPSHYAAGSSEVLMVRTYETVE